MGSGCAVSLQAGRRAGARSVPSSDNQLAGLPVVSAVGLMGPRPNHSFKRKPLRGSA